MGIIGYIGTKTYNGIVKRRNKFVRGEYHVKDKATKAANYLNSVGTNIVTDVQTGQPRDAFPFRIPKNSTNLTKKHRQHESKRATHQHSRRKKRNGNHNPYPLI